MKEGRGLVSIWFFIGVLLFAYGILILGSGVYQLYNPPVHDVVLGRAACGRVVGSVSAAAWGLLQLPLFPWTKQIEGIVYT